MTDFLAADAEAQMDQWGEEITYTPRTGAERSMLAIVTRKVPREVGPQSEAVRPAITIEVLNRATASGTDGYGGISSAEVNTGGDKVTVAEHIGGTARAMAVLGIVDQDEAMLTLELG